MACLPKDVIVSEILPRMCAADVFRFKMASKFWWDAISDPEFVKSHLVSRRSRIDGYEKAVIRVKVVKEEAENNSSSSSSSSVVVLECSHRSEGDFRVTLSPHIFTTTSCSPPQFPHRVMASCNGLVLLAAPLAPSSLDEDYCIINPATRHFLKLPQPKVSFTRCLLHYHHPHFVLFGWDTESATSIDRMRARHTSAKGSLMRALVLDAQTTKIPSQLSWLKFDDDPSLDGFVMPHLPVVYQNVWFCWTIVVSCTRALLAINSQTMHHRRIELPDPICQFRQWNLAISVINGCFYCLAYHDHHDLGHYFCYTLWVLQDFNNQIWTKLYHNQVHECPRCSFLHERIDNSYTCFSNPAWPGLSLAKEILLSGAGYEESEMRDGDHGSSFPVYHYANTLVWFDNI